jgi:hypothetical protein
MSRINVSPPIPPQGNSILRPASFNWHSSIPLRLTQWYQELHFFGLLPFHGLTQLCQIVYICLSFHKWLTQHYPPIPQRANPALTTSLHWPPLQQLVLTQQWQQLHYTGFLFNNGLTQQWQQLHCTVLQFHCRLPQLFNQLWIFTQNLINWKTSSNTNSQTSLFCFKW